MNVIQKQIIKLWDAGQYYEVGILIKDHLNKKGGGGFQNILVHFHMASREEIMDELTNDIDRLKRAQQLGKDLSTSLLDPLSDMTLKTAYQRLHALNHSSYPIYKINGQNHQYNGVPASKGDLLRLMQDQ